MKFTLTIDCDNAAFEGKSNAEIVRYCLERTRTVVPSGEILSDNGNTVGRFELTEDGQ